MHTTIEKPSTIQTHTYFDDIDSRTRMSDEAFGNNPMSHRIQQVEFRVVSQNGDQSVHIVTNSIDRSLKFCDRITKSVTLAFSVLSLKDFSLHRTSHRAMWAEVWHGKKAHILLTSAHKQIKQHSSAAELSEICQKEGATLPDGLIDWYIESELTSFDFKERQLEFLPDSLGRLAQVRTVVLTKNRLRSLPASFGDLGSLVEVNLMCNQLTELPDSICRLTSLVSLTLEENQIRSLPERIGDLRNLQVLNLEGNQLETFPESFCHLRKLRDLYVNSNRLRSLPKLFGNLENLSMIHMQLNKLESLPESFGSLSRLKNLFLNNNKIRVLPESFGRLRLKSLSLDGNLLTTFLESFEHFRVEEHASLERNPLSERTIKQLEHYNRRGQYYISYSYP